MKETAVLALLVIGANYVHAQADFKIWTRLAGTSNLDEGYAVAADPSANCIIAGGTRGSLYSSNQGRYDLFVAKYDTGGKPLWGRQRGTSQREFAFGLATDPSGNIYATGYTGAALDGQSHAGNWDIFLTKFGPTGDWLWTRQIGAGQDDEGYAVSTDTSGNVYITGYVRGNIHGQTQVGSADVIICKYNPAGTRLWTRLFGSVEIDQAWAVACDASGSVFVSGYTLGSIAGNAYVANGDLFLAKYNPAGTRLWFTTVGTASGDCARGVATAAGGVTFLSGTSYGPLDGNTNQGDSDVLAMKFAPGPQRRR